MTDLAQNLLQAHLTNNHLSLFATRLLDWLIADLNSSEEPAPEFTESRAKALLRAANVVDDPTRHSFIKLMESNPTAVRVALYTLLKESGIAENDEVGALTAVTGQTAPPAEQPHIQWSALAVAAFAWQNGYPLYQLDPASPPDPYTPAGQLITRAGHFMRQQVQRTATERDKLGRLVAYSETAVSNQFPNLNEMSQQDPIAPVPPYYRPPIPVTYPEFVNESIEIEADDAVDPVLNVEPANEPPAPPPSPRLTITEEDLPQPQRMPPLRIDQNQVPPTPRRVTGTRPQNEFGRAIRRKYRSRGAMTTTKLRLIVQEYADGPGIYGVQVHVKCRGVRSFVAGTTNRDGRFLCEIPVPRNGALTYEAEVIWPRDFGGDTERKSVTLHADRTEFTLPFYQRFNP